MSQIPLITNSKEIAEKVDKILEQHPEYHKTPIQISNLDEAVEFLNYEMPELMIIDFSDEASEPFKLLQIMMDDPWLLHAGIIALYSHDEDNRKLEEIHGANIIVTISDRNMEEDLSKVLSLVNHDRRILFQRSIGNDLIQDISGSFIINNELLEVDCYINLICNFLYNANRIDMNVKMALHMVLSEILINAVEHGNCGISYEEKTKWLEESRNINILIQKKCESPQIANRKVTFEYIISESCSKFTVADQGDGFDWRKVNDPTKDSNIMKKHGRGILMSKAITESLVYNEKGNEVSFEIKHSKEATITPGLFRGLEPKDIKQGDKVISEGNTSGILYYIVAGEYDIFKNDNKLATLTADDMFLGEVSFLLNSERTASVIAKTDGKLIEVPKREFTKAIKKEPYYAILLARLLAERLQRLNESIPRSSE